MLNLGASYDLSEYAETNVDKMEPIRRGTTGKNVPRASTLHEIVFQRPGLLGCWPVQHDMDGLYQSPFFLVFTRCVWYVCIHIGLGRCFGLCVLFSNMLNNLTMSYISDILLCAHVNVLNCFYGWHVFRPLALTENTEFSLLGWRR